MMITPHQRNEFAGKQCCHCMWRGISPWQSNRQRNRRCKKRTRTEMRIATLLPSHYFLIVIKVRE